MILRRPAAPGDSHRVAYVALLVCTVLVAVTTFVLSFAGLTDYGRRVADLGGLSPLVPIGVDGLTLCAVAATFILRDARLRVRLYAWSAFAVAVALSVAGNLSHAAARSLSWEGMIGAAAWPILLALASHMVIVVRRNMHPGDTVSTPAAPVRVIWPAGSALQYAAPIGPEPAPGQVDSLSTSTVPARKPQPSSRERVERAHRRTPNATNEELARRLNLSTRTVARWRPTKAPSSVDNAAAINGHAVAPLVRAEVP